MKLDDLKWAVGELVSAALGRQHKGCDCHPPLAYRGPRRHDAPKEAGGSEQGASQPES